MGIPLVANDQGGPYTLGLAPPLIAVFVTGSTRVFIKNKPIMLVGAAVTTLGSVISSTLNSTKTMIEGKPVILGGSVTNLSSGYSNGTVFALGAIGVLVS